MLRLTREVRFGIDLGPTGSTGRNGHGGRPGLGGFGAFLVLRVTVAGEPDRDSGYLLNIKQIDEVVRSRAVPALRESVLAEPTHTPEHALKHCVSLLVDAWRPIAVERLELCISPYLSYTWSKSEPDMICLSQKFEFSASHRLHNPALADSENVALFGKCNNPHGHGHNYEVQVTIAGQVDAKTGQLMSVADLERVVDQHVIQGLDHKHLNVEVEEFWSLNPSVENIAKVIYERLAPVLGEKIHKVTVWETPKTWAEYSR